jgi:hypothetical protein
MEQETKRVLGYCCPKHGFFQQKKPDRQYECFKCEGPGVPIHECVKDYKCSRCGEIYTGFFAPECCGQTAAYHIAKTAAPYLIGAKAFESFVSPATGKVVSSMAAYRDDLKESNCVPYEPGIRQDQERNKARSEKETDSLVDKIVRDTAAEIGGIS